MKYYVYRATITFTAEDAQGAAKLADELFTNLSDECMVGIDYDPCEIWDTETNDLLFTDRPKQTA